MKNRMGAGARWIGILAGGVFLLFGLRWFGVWGDRVIFKASHQYQEARAAELATYEAQLTEIEAQLRRGDLNPSVREHLKAQAAALRVRIDTARRR